MNSSDKNISSDKDDYSAAPFKQIAYHPSFFMDLPAQAKPP
jgi:outer membrane phospholipase A